MKMDAHERDPTSEDASSLIDEFELLSSEADLIFGVDTKGGSDHFNFYLG